MIAPIGFDETEEQYIARLEAEIARQAASHGSAVGEKQASDAPIWYAHAEAHAWADGYNAAPKLTAAETSLQNPQTSPERPDHAQAPISSDDLTDYVVDAALSEYWDLSPRGWHEGQRAAMRKAILTALAMPSATRGSGAAMIDNMTPEQLANWTDDGDCNAGAVALPSTDGKAPL